MQTQSLKYDLLYSYMKSDKKNSALNFLKRIVFIVISLLMLYLINKSQGG